MYLKPKSDTCYRGPQLPLHLLLQMVGRGALQKPVYLAMALISSSGDICIRSRRPFLEPKLCLAQPSFLVYPGDAHFAII